MSDGGVTHQPSAWRTEGPELVQIPVPATLPLSPCKPADPRKPDKSLAHPDVVGNIQSLEDQLLGSGPQGQWTLHICVFCTHGVNRWQIKNVFLKLPLGPCVVFHTLNSRTPLLRQEAKAGELSRNSLAIHKVQQHKQEKSWG